MHTTSPGVENPQPRNEEDPYGIVPINETPYMTEQAAQLDPRTAITQALLADTTYPLSVLPGLRKIYNADDFPNQSTDVREKMARRALGEFMLTGTATDLRARAKQIAGRTTSKPPLGQDSDLGFRQLADADRTHEAMQTAGRRFIDDLTMARGTRVESLDASTEDIVEQLRGSVMPAVHLERNRQQQKGGKANVEVELTLPANESEGSKWNWDAEHVQLKIAPDGHIQTIRFDERYNDMQYCNTVKQLAAANIAGAELTPSQQALLQHSGIVEDLPQNYEQVPFLTPANPDTFVSPLLVFPFVLPPKLAEKIVGHSLLDGYSTMKRELGPLIVNGRKHDMGGMQYIIEIDTGHLTDEDAWKLISSYIDTLKAFPRIRRQSKQG